MEVTRIWHTPLSISATAGRVCWDSYHKGGCYTFPTDDLQEADKEFLERVVNKNKHGSIAEHCNITFRVTGLSRACLQELARHRIQSLSVESSRYVLKKLLKAEKPFCLEHTDTSYVPTQDAYVRAAKYVVFTEDVEVNYYILIGLENLRRLVATNKPNDVIKYAMGEAFKTTLFSTWNLRSLANLICLRTSSAALKEFQELATQMYWACPESYHLLLQPYLQTN